jgi:transposase
MPAKINQGRVDQLAVHVARGLSVRGAAKHLGVSDSTAARWAATPGFDATVRRLRAKAIDRAVSILSSNAAKAALTLVRACGKGKPDNIQVAAARAILTDLMAVQDHAEILERLEQLEQNKGAYGASQSRKFG